MLVVLGLATALGATLGVDAAQGQAHSSAQRSNTFPGVLLLHQQNAMARRLLNEAVVPARARRVSANVGDRLLQSPATVIGCSPLIDDTRFWIVPEGAYVVDSFLMDNAPKGLAVSSTGSYGGPSQSGDDLIDTPVGGTNWKAELEFTTTEWRLNTVIVRADALIAARGARCESSSPNDG
jgi:hypothetical protein